MRGGGWFASGVLLACMWLTVSINIAMARRHEHGILERTWSILTSPLEKRKFASSLNRNIFFFRQLSSRDIGKLFFYNITQISPNL
jgi:hypothetical protein